MPLVNVQDNPVAACLCYPRAFRKMRDNRRVNDIVLVVAKRGPGGTLVRMGVLGDPVFVTCGVSRMEKLWYYKQSADNPFLLVGRLWRRPAFLDFPCIPRLRGEHPHKCRIV
jgi:hypothetical protein